MLKVVCSDRDGLLRESTVREGMFVSTQTSYVRDYRAGGSKILPLPVVRIDTEAPQQEILGFGGAFTDASCYLISRLDPEKRAELLDHLYSPQRFNFNVGRTTVAQCDFGRVCYSYNDTPGDVEMKHFNIDYDREYIIPTITAARAINPDLFLLSSPWSPPGWMKTGGLMTGGWMRAEYLEAFAEYYVRYLAAYAEAGITINALTPQNETETDQLSQMPACYWHPDLEQAFVRDHLTPKLKARGLSPELWIVDHNYIMWRRAKWMLDDPAAKALIAGVAFHPYEGNPGMMLNLLEAHPDTPLHMTEIGGSRQHLQSAEDVCTISRNFTEMLRHQVRSIFCWNIALDEFGRPNIGPFLNVAGMVQIHSQTNEVTFNAQINALAHYSAHIRRGARCLASAGTFAGLSHSAFRNPDGGIVVVLTNTGEATEVSLDLKGRYATLPISEMSVTTVLIPQG
jgi:glucosylceramidase